MTDVIQERIKSLEQRLALEPQSPLFARLASYYLQAGRASDALRLCDDGLALYPFYSTAHLVKGKALVELGMLAEAKHEYVVVHELLPTNESLALLASSIEMSSSGEPSVVAMEESAPEPEVEVAPQVEEPIAVEPLVAAEEAMPPQEHVIADESFVSAEPSPLPEPFEKEPEAILPTETSAISDDSFATQGRPEYEAEQPPPSGYESPGVGEEEQPAAVDTAFAPAAEAPPVQPTPTEETQTVSMDYGFAAQPVEEIQPTEPEYGFGATAETPPAEPIAEAASSVPEPVEPQPPVGEEDAFGIPITPPAARAVAEPPVEVTLPIPEPPMAAPASPQADQTPDWFEAFSQLQQPAAETTEAPTATPTEEENPFAVFGTEEAPAAPEGESFDEFAARTRMELFGTEDTSTLEEYFGSSATKESPGSPDQIGELAEKLKTSPRITPPVINFSEKAPRPASEMDSSSGSGFVTPTLAEIYVKQGWFDDAIKAYRALISSKPAEKDRFEQRIIEIEEMKRSGSK